MRTGPPILRSVNTLTGVLLLAGGGATALLGVFGAPVVIAALALPAAGGGLLALKLPETQ